MDDTTTRTPPRVSRSPWWEIVRVFLTLGALSPSGPGLTGVLQTEVQEKRAWLSQARFVEGVALVNMLPGPSGAQMSMGFLAHPPKRVYSSLRALGMGKVVMTINT